MRKLFLLLVCFNFMQPVRSLKYWRKEVLNRDIDGYWCCSCVGYNGEQVCGCYAVTVWEYCIWSSLPRWVAERLAPHVWRG